jgi:hypothetical protein
MLATLSPVDLLASEYKRISNLTQGTHETPRDFSHRIRTAASRLGPLMYSASVSILLEGLHPSISVFVRSALRNQKPTFSNVIQESELIHRSVAAANPTPRPRTLTGTPMRTRQDALRPYREARPVPMLSFESSPYADGSTPVLLPDD